MSRKPTNEAQRHEPPRAEAEPCAGGARDATRNAEETRATKCRGARFWYDRTLRQPMRMNWRDRVSSDPQFCHGQVCVKDTRIMVSVIFDNLDAGHSVDRILRAIPTLIAYDIQAAIAYASELTLEIVVTLPRST